MRLILLVVACAVALALAGCADGGFVGSPNAVQGQFSTPWGVSGEFVPTIVDNEHKQMGSETMAPDGTVLRKNMFSTYRDPSGMRATGTAADYLALAWVCRMSECGEDLLDRMLP